MIMKEKRIYNDVSFRAVTGANGNDYFEGYAAVFGVRSKLIYENGEFFYEEIRLGAFDDVLIADNLNVILTYQHNRNDIMARYTKKDGVEIANSLELSVDEKGLKFRTIIPNTTKGNDLKELLKRGDIFECSFVFTVKDGGYRWEYVEGVEEPLRVVERIAGLFDVSIVVDGAYTETDIAVATRELKEFKQNVEEITDVEKLEIRNNSDILKLKTAMLKINNK